MRLPFSRRSVPALALEVEPRPAVELEEKAAAPVLTSPATLANPDPALLELFGIEPSLTGEAFTAETAMRCTASRAAIQAIAEPLGALPVHVFGLATNGTRKRDEAHPVDALLNSAVSSWAPAPEFRELLTRDALLFGRGVAFINRASDGRILELQRLIPGTVSVNVDTMTGEPSYLYGDRTLSAADVIDIRAPFIRWPVAGSPTHDCREAIALALVLERHAARLFGNGARPSGVVSFPAGAKVPPDRVTNVGRTFKALFSSQNSGGTAVMTDGAVFTPLTFKSVDSEFMAQRKFAIEEIARAYRVPPVLLMEYGRATWGNSEEMGRQFVTYTLTPWIKRWTSEIKLKLLGDEATFAEFQLDDLLKADTAQRFEAYSKAIASRWLNPNEVRARENLPPCPGGDVFINPAVISAVDQAER